MSLNAMALSSSGDPRFSNTDTGSWQTPARSKIQIIIKVLSFITRNDKETITFWGVEWRTRSEYNKNTMTQLRIPT
jgi:hypothetical protein